MHARVVLTRFSLALLCFAPFAITTAATAQADGFYTDLEYLCKGERISVQCAYDDKSDSAHCQLTNHTRHQANGNLTYTSSTRGEVRKLFATCTPPSAEDIAEKARMDASTRKMQDDAVAQQQQYRQQMQARAPGGATVDPGTQAMRNCAAAGRDLMQCFGEVMGSSVQQVTGNNMPGVGKIMAAGLRMTGRYGAGQLGLTFSESQVLVACSGGAYTAPYAVARNANNQITVSVTPDAPHQRIGIKPFALVVQPSGVLTATGPINAIVERSTGITSTQSVQTSRHYLTQQELQSSYSNRLNEVHRDEGGNLYVDVQPATMHTAGIVTCNVSTIQPLGSSGNTNASQALGQAGSMMAGLLGSAQQSSGKGIPWPGPGLRLTGTYAVGPLGFEFHEESVAVGCGQTLDARDYSVNQTGAALVVRIDNHPQPLITLLMQPNGTLTGSGTVQISGHSFNAAGGQGQPYTAASTARCTLGNLLPRS